MDGRAAADLQLLGAIPSAHPVLDFINPAPGARRAGASAWRIGRLRSALPLLAVDLMANVDRQPADFPPPGDMLSGQLLDAIAWGRQVLSSLHAQEYLAGALLGAGSGATAAGEALAELMEGRRRGLSDEQLLERHPVLLALLPPTLGDRPPLPQRTGSLCGSAPVSAGSGLPHWCCCAGRNWSRRRTAGGCRPTSPSGSPGSRVPDGDPARDRCREVEVVRGDDLLLCVVPVDR